MSPEDRLPFGPRWDSPRRVSTFGPMNVISPNLDAMAPDRRLDENAPVVMATLGGRSVALVRPDPSTRPPGMPSDYTIPISMSRMRRARDIELDRATGPYDRSAILGVGDWEGLRAVAALTIGLIALGGAGAGYYAAKKTKAIHPVTGAVTGAVAGIVALALWSRS